MHCVLSGEKTPNTTFAAPVRLRLVSKIHKKLIEFFHKSVILTVAAKMGEKAFFSIWKSFSAFSCWYFGDFPCNSIVLVTFPSHMRLNIEGRQDFRKKTQIFFFCSENNLVSLNCPPNINLIVVQCGDRCAGLVWANTRRRQVRVLGVCWFTAKRTDNR